MQLATVLTTTNGVWDFVVKPTLLTTYEAHWKTLVSAKIGLAMRPNVLFSASKGMGIVKVKTNHSLQGRKVFVQRFTRFGQWVKMKRVILGRSSQRLFYLRLPRGTYTLRVFMSYNQAGADTSTDTAHVIFKAESESSDTRRRIVRAVYPIVSSCSTASRSGPRGARRANRNAEASSLTGTRRGGGSWGSSTRSGPGRAPSSELPWSMLAPPRRVSRRSV